MEYKVEKKKANSYKIDVKVSKNDVKKIFEKAIEESKDDVKVDGFRKGKAPLNKIKDSLDQTKLKSLVTNKLLNDTYIKLINENKYKPITHPFFSIKTDLNEDKDFEFTVEIVEKPTIKIGDYKKELSNLGKSKSKDDKTEIDTKATIDAILRVCDVEIAKVLVDTEKNKMLSSLIDQVSKLGLTIDQYLNSQKKNIDDIKKEYEETAKNTIKADLVLTELSKIEEIKVDDKDVDDTIKAVPDEKSRKVLESPEQKMYIKAVLLKNKTIKKLKNYIKS